MWKGIVAILVFVAILVIWRWHAANDDTVVYRAATVASFNLPKPSEPTPHTSVTPAAKLSSPTSEPTHLITPPPTLTTNLPTASATNDDSSNTPLPSIIRQLKSHAINGLAQQDLELLNSQLKAMNAQFLIVENRSRYTVAQNFFSASNQKIDISDRISRQGLADFLDKLAVCSQCDKQFSADLPTLYEANFNVSPHDYLLQVIKQNPAIYKRYPTFFAWYFASLLPIYDLESPYLAQSPEILSHSANHKFRELGQSIEQLLNKNYLSWLDAWLKNPDDPLLADMWLSKLLMQQGYDVMWQWVERNIETLYKVNPDYTLDLLLFHGQFFSVQQAWQLLDRLQSQFASIRQRGHYQTLWRAKSAGKQLIAADWPNKVADIESSLEKMWLDKRGNEVTLLGWHSRLAAMFASLHHPDALLSTWTGQFMIESDGLEILEKYSDYPLMLKFRILLITGDAYINEVVEPWNVNIASLNNANVVHQLEAISLMHWRLYSFWLKEKNATQLDELVLYLYDFATPDEQLEIQKMYQQKLKAGHQFSALSWNKLQ